MNSEVKRVICKVLLIQTKLEHINVIRQQERLEKASFFLDILYLSHTDMPIRLVEKFDTKEQTMPWRGPLNGQRTLKSTHCTDVTILIAHQLYYSFKSTVEGRRPIKTSFALVNLLKKGVL